MDIVGHTIKLIPAQESDRIRIYNWLCRSNLTSSVIGPPKYPEYPIPTWPEFCDEYPLSFFSAAGDGKGRVFIITTDGGDVGTIGYDLLDIEKNSLVLDIWMKAEQYCGHGYGSDALNTLSAYIYAHFGITDFFILPSKRNKRVLAAFLKAGFECVKIMNKQEQEKEFGYSEYDDNVLMIKRLGPTQSN